MVLRVIIHTHILSTVTREATTNTDTALGGEGKETIFLLLVAYLEYATSS